jgi:hypothetical protein
MFFHTFSSVFLRLIILSRFLYVLVRVYTFSPFNHVLDCFYMFYTSSSFFISCLFICMRHVVIFVFMQLYVCLGQRFEVIWAFGTVCRHNFCHEKLYGCFGAKILMKCLNS